MRLNYNADLNAAVAYFSKKTKIIDGYYEKIDDIGQTINRI